MCAVEISLHGFLPSLREDVNLTGWRLGSKKEVNGTVMWTMRWKPSGLGFAKSTQIFTGLLRNRNSGFWAFCDCGDMGIVGH